MTHEKNSFDVLSNYKPHGKTLRNVKPLFSQFFWFSRQERSHLNEARRNVAAALVNKIRSLLKRIRNSLQCDHFQKGLNDPTIF